MKNKQYRKNNRDTTTNSTGRTTDTTTNSTGKTTMMKQQTVQVEQQRYNNKQNNSNEQQTVHVEQQRYNNKQYR
jgi:hypothetical protein